MSPYMSVPMHVEPVTLYGNHVRLEPLGHEHATDLLEAASHDAIWTYLDEPTPRTISQIRALIDQAHDERASGVRLPFATVDSRTDRAVGSTSYINIRPQDRGVEIGWTWLTPSAWGTGINTETKYLLLRHAFEDLHAIRVAIKTDLRNVRSQRAILALGASTEGVWRNHCILSDGYRRSTVYYSVIDTEWPTVGTRLRKRVAFQPDATPR